MLMSVLLSISIFPLDKGESLSPYVARALKVIQESGLPYHFSPMETTVEAETIEEILDLIRKCFQILEPDCNRIVCNMKIDYRKGPVGRIVSKIKSVEEKLSQSQ